MECCPLKPAQVATAYDQTLILSRLVEDLRLLSLAEARQLHLEKSETDVGLLVQSVVDNFRPLAQERGVDLRTQVPAVPTMAAVDPQRISQVVANLLSNALRYVVGGDSVTVAVRRTDTRSEVSVSDSGPGIDEDELPHVFERFYRVEKSRSRSAGGSGLGLAIAKELRRDPRWPHLGRKPSRQRIQVHLRHPDLASLRNTLRTAASSSVGECALQSTSMPALHRRNVPNCRLMAEGGKRKCRGGVPRWGRGGARQDPPR